jgi:hypothetical protein
LDFVPFKDAPSPPMTDDLRAACVTAVHAITADGRVIAGGAAATFVLGVCGQPRLARALNLPGVRMVVAGAYRLAAKYRGAIWGSRGGRWLVCKLFRSG